ncbi:MAG TPA: hypothetical protein VFR03_17760, partial [Thermoanaerobaculia bacterium]|nr:hypothetical protein [Thermoanaerobaculia bacterium]
VAALPIWRSIAEDGLKNGWMQKDEPFPVPQGVVVKDIEYSSGLLSAKGGKTIKEAFVAGTEPAREHDAQWNTINSLPWYQQKAFYIPKEGEKMPGGKPDAGAAAAPPPVGEGEQPQQQPSPEGQPAPEAPPPP